MQNQGASQVWSFWRRKENLFHTCLPDYGGGQWGLKMHHPHHCFQHREGSRIGDPNMCHFGTCIVLGWRWERLSWHRKRLFDLSVNCLKEFREPVPGREQIPRITFYIRKTYLHGMANICLPNICSSSYELPSSPLNPDPYPLLLNLGWHISLSCLTLFVVPYIYIICFSSVSLS